MEKKNSLKKEQINGIKYFIRMEEIEHKFGSWDRFKITSLRVHTNGDYSFFVNWMRTYSGIHDDYYVKGNFFDEFPIFAVYDGLDAVQMLFHRIHRKAFQRNIEYSLKDIASCDSDFEHLKNNIYPLGCSFNKENKIIRDVRDE